jgi:hypothetical protein
MWLTIGKTSDKFKHLFERVAKIVERGDESNLRRTTTKAPEVERNARTARSGGERRGLRAGALRRRERTRFSSASDDEGAGGRARCANRKELSVVPV